MIEPNPNESSQFETDSLLFQDFLTSWENGSFSTLHPVYGLIRNQAYLLCHRFNQQNEVEDLIQSSLILLSHGRYKGKCPLGAYINTILRSGLVRKWKEREKVSEIDESILEIQTPPIFEEIFRRFSSEKFMHDLMLSNLELEREIIKTILSHDDERRLSRTKIIRTLEKKKYQRYKIIQAFEKLRKLLLGDFPLDNSETAKSQRKVQFVTEETSTFEEGCLDGDGVWPDLLDLDASDNEIERHCEHIEKCPYHLKLAEMNIDSFRNFLSSMDNLYEDKDFELSHKSDLQHQSSNTLSNKHLYYEWRPLDIKRKLYSNIFLFSPETKKRASLW